MNAAVTAHRARRLSPQALDFAPGLLAIQESPPARLPRTILLTVSVLFAILLAWAVFGRLDIIASAEGRLVPQTYLKIVQPADAGIVREILVKEGESVQAGQVLMRMDMTLAQADAATIAHELALRSLQLRRIDAELAGRPLPKHKDDPFDLYQQAQAQYQARRDAYLDALGQARSALNKAERDVDSARQVLIKLRKSAPLLKQQADAYADLGRNGYVAQVMVWEKERDYHEKAQDLKAQEATIESLNAAVEQARKQLDAVGSRYRSELRNERMEAQGQYDKLQQERVKQVHKTDLLELRAPQAGVVKDLATHTIGTVVSPGSVLLSIVPENEPLVAQVGIRNEDVGFVYPGHRVKVKLAAYPFQKYGMLDGRVMHIGPDAADADSQQTRDASRAIQAQPAFYKATIALDSQTLGTGAQNLKLVAGMLVVTEIDQGNRSVMEYLLSPVQKTVQESGHER